MIKDPVVAVSLPLPLYHRLERLAALSHHSLEQVVVRTLDSHLPTLPEGLPEASEQELSALERLDDAALWRVARSTISHADGELYQTLAEKRQFEPLTEAEQGQLDRLRAEADQRMLSKAYAYVLLKWRGHRLPTLAELEAERG